MHINIPINICEYIKNAVICGSDINIVKDSDFAHPAQPNANTLSLNANQLIKAISHALNERIKKNKKINGPTKFKKMLQGKCFDNIKIPSISVEDYLQYLFVHVYMKPCLNEKTNHISPALASVQLF